MSARGRDGSERLFLVERSFVADACVGYFFARSCGPRTPSLTRGTSTAPSQRPIFQRKPRPTPDICWRFYLHGRTYRRFYRSPINKYYELHHNFHGFMPISVIIVMVKV